MQKLSQEKEKNISEVDKYKNEFKRVEKEKEEFVAKFNDNFKLLEVVRLENEKQSRQIKRYSDENEELLQKVDILDQDFQDEKIASAKLYEKITEKDHQIEEQAANFQRRLLDEQKVILELRSKIEASEAQVHSKDDELLQKVDALEKDLRNEKIANEKLHSEIKEKDHQTEENAENFDALKQKLLLQEDHNNELLSEIRQMNEELMQRGTKLSAQEDTISKLEQTVITKDNSLREAQEEVSYLKEQSLNKSNVGNDNADDSKSEIMSTSTANLSRVEDSSRMADLESSFEDRYSKLKVIAIKLKKRVHEQEKQIKELQLQVKTY